MCGKPSYCWRFWGKFSSLTVYKIMVGAFWTAGKVFKSPTKEQPGHSHWASEEVPSPWEIPDDVSPILSGNILLGNILSGDALWGNTLSGNICPFSPILTILFPIHYVWVVYIQWVHKYILLYSQMICSTSLYYISLYLGWEICLYDHINI